MTVRPTGKYSYRLNGTGPDPAATARGRGTCWCGCGKPTLLAKSTWLAHGHRIGVPQRYAPRMQTASAGPAALEQPWHRPPERSRQKDPAAYLPGTGSAA